MEFNARRYRRVGLYVIAFVVVVVVGANVSGFNIIQPPIDGRSGIDADQLDGRERAAFTWSDSNIDQTDIDISDINPADADLNMNSNNIINCGFVNGVNCSDLVLSTSSLATLEEFLNVNNSAGAQSMDLNGNRILNAANLGAAIAGEVWDPIVFTNDRVIVESNRTFNTRDVIWESSLTGGSGTGVDHREFVYAGGSGGVVRKFMPNGTEMWSHNPAATTIWDLQFDPTTGAVYYGDSSAALTKLAPNGTVIWSQTGHTTRVVSVGVDILGHIYAGDADGSVYKYFPNGTQIWSQTNLHGAGNDVLSVRPAVDGQVITAGQDNVVRRLFGNGTVRWSFTGHTGNVYADVAPSGNTYTVSADGTARRIFANGTEAWQVSETATPTDIAVDSLDYLHISSTDNTVAKRDMDGVLVADHTFANNVDSVDVDDEGSIYVGGDFNTLQKLTLGSKADVYRQRWP